MFRINFRVEPARIIVLFLIGLICQWAMPAGQGFGMQDRWQAIGKYEGVNLYRRVNETKGLLPFKAVAELNIYYEKIVMALVDAERKAHWAPKLKSTAVHAQLSSNCFEYSEYYQTPWPFKDREFLLLGEVKYLPERIIFTAQNSKNKQLARKNHLVANIRKLSFVIIPLGPNRTRVEFTFSGDLGGWIPTFVKVIIQKKWPVRFIQALENYVIHNDSLATKRYNLLLKTNMNF